MSDRLCVQITCGDQVDIYQLSNIEFDIFSIVKEIVEKLAANFDKCVKDIGNLLDKFGAVTKYEITPQSDLTIYINSSDTSVCVKLESMPFPDDIKKVLDNIPGGYGISERLDGIAGTPEEVLAALNTIVEFPDASD